VGGGSVPKYHKIYEMAANYTVKYHRSNKIYQVVIKIPKFSTPRPSKRCQKKNLPSPNPARME
jgi:hypothetical protein